MGSQIINDFGGTPDNIKLRCTLHLLAKQRYVTALVAGEEGSIQGQDGQGGQDAPEGLRAQLGDRVECMGMGHIRIDAHAVACGGVDQRGTHALQEVGGSGGGLREIIELA